MSLQNKVLQIKTASAALVNFLNAVRSAKDSRVVFADRFTFTLAVGTVPTYSNADVPITSTGGANDRLGLKTPQFKTIF